MKEALGQLWHPVALIINYRSYFLNWKWNQHKKYIKSLTAVVCCCCFLLWSLLPFTVLDKTYFEEASSFNCPVNHESLLSGCNTSHPITNCESQIHCSSPLKKNWNTNSMKLNEVGRQKLWWLNKEKEQLGIRASCLLISLFFVSAPHTPYPSHVIFSGSFSVEVHSFL